MLRGGLERQEEPGVLPERLPAHEGEPSAGSKRRAQVRERRHGVGKEHDAEARVDDVEGARGKPMCLRVGVLEADVRQARRARRLGGAFEHRGGDIDAEDQPRGPDAPGEGDRRVAAAAADVDHALAGGDARPIHRALAERRDLRVDDLLEGHPLRAGGLVPVADLLGVGLGCGHGLPIRVDSSPESKHDEQR